MEHNSLERSIGFQLGQTYRKINYLMTVMFKPFDLTPEQWVVLCCINGTDGIHPTELAQRAHKDKTTITRILDHLERKGAIQKQANTEDRRSFFVFLTEHGKSCIQSLAAIEKATLGTILQTVSDEKLSLLREMFDVLQANVNKELERLQADVKQKN
ncbi:MarR family transcriptional regulator [Fodinisporobacter ferrooxydans]|uniref:MarR family transcriptional regulator n=1 Tax=Fodinisporobacter ferrooxydans TaxID=2901836 RepID=A0ABY4CIP5_9BACL|nr:MarR family transcriptional regulator [Alicyclobacillaceae bacterium MYW30-H2]